MQLESEDVPDVTDMSKYDAAPEETTNQNQQQKEPESSGSFLDLFWAPVCQYFNSDYTKKRKNKTKEQIEKSVSGKHDLYAVFGLEDNVFEATDQQIKTRYRKASLQFHPDKLGRKVTERDKEIWQKIQQAYETLLDPAKRRRYDSSLPFDETIPEESQITSDKKFYQLFNRAFVNNARFSIIKPVPSLGKEHATMQEVDEFYKFWFSFKTWRDFSQYDEYDLEEAQDRYEARWMGSQNRKVRAEYEGMERRRVNELVTRSYNQDPRIKA
jgi:DnaJ family protein C protein 2